MESDLVAALVERWLREATDRSMSTSELSERAKRANIRDGQLRDALKRINAINYGGFLWGLRPDARSASHQNR